LNEVGKEVATETVKKSPLLATIIAITGTVVTTVLAVKATPKALESLDKLYSKKEEPTKFEVVKTAAPHYIPAALSLGVTVAAEVFCYNEMSNRYGLALTTCGILEEEIARKNEKIVEYVGQRKARRMDEEIANEKRKQRSPMTDSTEVIFTGNGQSLCYDTLSGRYFRNDMQGIKAAINIFNMDFIEERDGNAFDDPPEKEINDLYILLGLGKIGYGKLVTSKIIDINGIFGSDITETGEPCLTIDLERYVHMPSCY
jgi:hypothetical protein